MQGARIHRLHIPLLVAVVFLTLVYAWYLYDSAHADSVERYIQSHEESPMVALPETSLPDMLRATEELQKSAEAAVLPFSDDRGATWNHDVYPIAFLKAAVVAEDARRTMLEEKSSESVEIYHAALVTLLSTYKAALTHDIDALRVGKNTSIASFGGTTNPTHIVSVLMSGTQGLVAMEHEEHRRYTCTHGDMLACAEWSFWSPSLAHASASMAQGANIPPVLPITVQEHRDAERIFKKEFGIQLTDVTTVALTQSACYPSFTPAYYDVASHPSSLSGVQAGYFTILNDSFFYDLKKIPVHFSKEYYKTGATYSNQPFNTYICQDFGQDVSLLLSIQDASETLEKNPIAAAHADNVPSLLQHVLAAQDAFRTESVPNELLYKGFIDAAEKFLTGTNPEDIQKMLATRNDVETLHTLVLASHTGSARFERVLGYFDDLQLGTYVTGKLDPYRTSIFFMLRGGFSALFMASNETGPFPRGVSFFETRSTHELPPTGYTLLSYEHDLKNTYVLSDLLSIDAHAHALVFTPFTAQLLRARK